MQQLSEQWQQQAQQWGADSQACQQVFNLLQSSYSGAQRFYHGIGHIRQMLELAQQQRAAIADWPAFFFAIWFHDLIQQNKGNNEELSAALAREYLQPLAVPEAVIAKAEQLILATRTHQYQTDSEVQLFMDIDLSILAAEPAAYRAYASQCRKEYFLPDFVYRFGRRRFLHELSEREWIFSSPYFRQHREQVARANIHWELEEWL